MVPSLGGVQHPGQWSIPLTSRIAHASTVLLVCSCESLTQLTITVFEPNKTAESFDVSRQIMR